jgi:hypothetical protein
MSARRSGSRFAPTQFAVAKAARTFPAGSSTSRRSTWRESGPWVQKVPEGLVKFIGVAEVSGALGVILPAATRIKPLLMPLAAAGFVVIMVLASGLHLSLGQPPIVQVILGGPAAFVACGGCAKRRSRPID